MMQLFEKVKIDTFFIRGKQKPILGWMSIVHHFETSKHSMSVHKFKILTIISKISGRKLDEIQKIEEFSKIREPITIQVEFSDFGLAK